MNIVTPIPTTALFPTTNLSTESAQRDNRQRDSIPASTSSEQSSSEKGLASDYDRSRPAGLAPPPVTYERPSPPSTSPEASNPLPTTGQEQDNAQDQSAGKEAAEERQQQSQQAEIQELKRRDAEVRAHEQAHAAAGGQYAGAPQYEYTTGPDGKRYAVAGEVSIDVSAAATPQDTIRKMQQVRAAALAPAEPSAQDRRVASEASQKAMQARMELAMEKNETPSQQDTTQTGVIIKRRYLEAVTPKSPLFSAVA